MKKNLSQEIFLEKFNITEKNATFYNRIFSTEWNLYIKIDSSLENAPNSIIKKIRERLVYKKIRYKYLFVSCGYGLVGYMRTDNIEKSIAALKSIENLDIVIENISNKNSDPLKVYVMLSAIAYNEEHGQEQQKNIFCSQNLEKNKIDFAGIVKECGKEIVNSYSKRNPTQYPNDFAFKGHLRGKQVEIIPQINQCGNGQLHFLITEYDKANKLTHFLYALCYIENYKIKEYKIKGKVEKVFYQYITNNMLFVYIALEKQTGNVVYVGVSEHIDSRIKRHFNPAERDSFKSINKMADSSPVKGYAFWSVHGNVPKTDENLKKFQNFKTSWEKYDVRLLPLTDYKAHFKGSEITRELAEAYVMETLLKESPDKIVYAKENMELFNKDIEEYNVPLFNCFGGTINSTRTQVQNCLNKHIELVSSAEFKKILLRTLIILRQDSSLNSKPLYDVLISHGLTYEESLRYAVGLSLEKKFFFDEKTGQDYIEVNNEIHLCSKDLADNILYKEKIVDYILQCANCHVEKEINNYE